MKVRQISIFLENKPGRLAKATRILGENGINIRALSIADTTDFGVLRLIVNEPEKAYNVLKEAGYIVRATEVIAVEIADEPGGLAASLEPLDKAGINIEYLYAFVQKASSAALVVLRVDHVDEAIEVFRQSGIRLLSEEEVNRL